jgi:hypothetical protein
MTEIYPNGERSPLTSPPPPQVRWGRWGNRPPKNTPTTTTRLGGVGVWWGRGRRETAGGEICVPAPRLVLRFREASPRAFGLPRRAG